jgi:small subunit ribosomal protein S6
MKHYELLIVLKPTLTEEETQAKVDFVKEVLEKNGAEIAAIDDRGMRKLAYEIQKHQRGHYFVFYFKAPPSSINEIERIVRITEEIIRFLNVKYENKKEIKQWETLSSAVTSKGKEEKKEEKKEEESAQSEG